MYDFYMHGMLNYEDDINILIANKEYMTLSGVELRLLPAHKENTDTMF